MDRVLDAGTATVESIDAHIAKLKDPDYRAFGGASIAARGSRPKNGRDR